MMVSVAMIEGDMCLYPCRLALRVHRSPFASFRTYAPLCSLHVKCLLVCVQLWRRLAYLALLSRHAVERERPSSEAHIGRSWKVPDAKPGKVTLILMLYISSSCIGLWRDTLCYFEIVCKTISLKYSHSHVLFRMGP